MTPIIAAVARSDSCGSSSSDEFTTSTATTTTTTTMLIDDSCRSSTISVASLSSCCSSSVSTSSTCSSSCSTSNSGRGWKTTLNAWKALKDKSSTSTTLVIRKFGKRRRRRRRRAVSFSEEPPLIIPTLTRYEYTKDEIDKCWFSESTLEKAIEKCKDMVTKKVSANGKAYCLRGLEKLSTIGNDIITINRNDGYAAVLYKQKNHFNDLELWNDDDHLNYDDWISQRYKTVSERCSKRAQKLASQDEIDAAKYLSSSSSTSKKKKKTKMKMKKKTTKKEKVNEMATTREIQNNQ